MVDFDTGLNSVIRKLRSALGDTSETPRYIEPLPRRGYRFIGTLALGYFGLERLTGSKPSVPGAASIAVLPLTNESGEVSQQYFSDGISEDLITALSQLPGLKVIGRNSAFRFRDSKEDGRSIASHGRSGVIRARPTWRSGR